jgi:hypothetical protein
MAGAGQSDVYKFVTNAWAQRVKLGQDDEGAF